MTTTETEKPCVRSCVRAGTDDDPQLLPARHGLYCSRCWGRLNQALLQAPELATHILGMVNTTGSAADDRVDASKEAPLPFNQAAFDDVSELYSLLVYWSSVFAGLLDQHRPAPAARAWQKPSGTVMGLPAGSTPETGGREVSRMARWLRDRLDDILALDASEIDEFDEAIRDVWRMNARWPRIERPRYSDMPCPRDDCGRRVAVYPPGFPGDVQRIVCEGGHWYPTDEYEHLVHVFQQARLEKARAELITTRLTRKYARATR